MQVDIYTDGACIGNCKTSSYSPGGWGWVAYFNAREFKTACGGEAKSTNSRMEITAILKALEWLATSKMISTATIYSDNKYCVDTLGEPILTGWIARWRRFNPPFKGKAHPDLWARISELVETLTARSIKVKIVWVKAHSGIVGNERADDLAEEGMMPYTTSK